MENLHKEKKLREEVSADVVEVNLGRVIGEVRVNRIFYCSICPT